MFQDSYASLDPRMRVAAILREPLAVQHIGSRKEQERRIADMLGHVGLPHSALERFPHEFSGGQRQRLAFARALILSPARRISSPRCSPSSTRAAGSSWWYAGIPRRCG
jgi:peptide/nickel transport system ATP-binding protein